MGKIHRRTFYDNRPPRETELSDCLTGPSITKEEIEKAIYNIKNNKAAGPDGIPSEILLDERGIAALHKIFNFIYDTGHYPEQWLCSTFIPLPKKSNARKCEDHRLISLKSHTLKIFLKIIHQRLYKKCERDISDSQFGFRRGLGTREAVVPTQVLVQNCYDQKRRVSMLHRLRKSFGPNAPPKRHPMHRKSTLSPKCSGKTRKCGVQHYTN